MSLKRQLFDMAIAGVIAGLSTFMIGFIAVDQLLRSASFSPASATFHGIRGGLNVARRTTNESRDSTMSTCRFDLVLLTTTAKPPG